MASQGWCPHGSETTQNVVNPHRLHTHHIPPQEVVQSPLPQRSIGHAITTLPKGHATTPPQRSSDCTINHHSPKGQEAMHSPLLQRSSNCTTTPPKMHSPLPLKVKEVKPLTTSSMITMGINPLMSVFCERPQPHSSLMKLSSRKTSPVSILQGQKSTLRTCKNSSTLYVHPSKQTTGICYPCFSEALHPKSYGSVLHPRLHPPPPPPPLPLKNGHGMEDQKLWSAASR